MIYTRLEVYIIVIWLGCEIISAVIYCTCKYAPNVLELYHRPAGAGEDDERVTACDR